MGEEARLAEEAVLVVDCQATSPSPRKGHLLEVGWARTRADENADPAPETHVIALRGKIHLPRRVRRITGLSPEELKAGASLESVWSRLAVAAAAVARTGAARACPTVIHYARFEEPILRGLHERFAGSRPFPLDIVCTHELARRLLPSLPRKGLRVVAGYFGHAVPELRRCRHHVESTAAVWRELARLLEDRHGIRSLQALREWLATTDAASHGHSYPMEARLRLELPDQPGVYRLRRCRGALLYVGKASSLRRRVNSYYQKRTRHAERTLEMLAQARRLDVSVTESALEAAVLESDEIKRFSPPYNVALRERGRAPGFWCTGLRSFSPTPDATHSVGPVPSRQSLAGLSALKRALEARRNAEELTLDLLSVPRDHAPAADCAREGLELLRRRHRLGGKGGLCLTEMLGVAARLWRERLRAAPSERGEDEAEAAEPWSWTPERVAGALELVLTRGAQLIRRARWLCALSESAVAWQEDARTDGHRRMLMISSGSLVRRATLSPEEPVPTPPGYGRPLIDRQRGFDLASYDRLVVVTNELRRLVAEGTLVELHLGRRRRLDRDALARVLPWV
jgi:DNA polymerase-3 subunit epsilon